MCSDRMNGVEDCMACFIELHGDEEDDDNDTALQDVGIVPMVQA